MVNRQLLCTPNQWNGFYMIGSTVVKELKQLTSSFLGILQHFLAFFAIKVTPSKEKSKWLFLYSDSSKKCFSMFS